MRSVLLLAAVVACGDNRAAKDDAPVDPSACRRGTTIRMRQVATVPGSLVLVTAPQGDRRQFIVEQAGRIRILEDESLRPEPFLDLSVDALGPVACCGERGLLGLAFHPRYATNGTFFVFYTTLTKNIVARYQRSPTDPYKADPASGVIVLSIDDFASNHNGGMIEFGPDGFLYIGTGDGGGGGDPHMNGQDTHALLAKMLRIDVDAKVAPSEYGIPPTNPFADGIGGAPEVYMIGLRNPWRWSFDAANGDLWIGDVGQELFEELDYLPASAIRGANLGWSSYEAMSCFKPPCDPATKVFPVATHVHATRNCSVIGGQVYRGTCYPDLVGKYFFTDYCVHALEMATVGATGDVSVTLPTTSYLDIGGEPVESFPVTPSSLHADGRGELYLTTVSCCGSSFVGAVYHLEVTP
jgi:glucose/arabinose dehydrogenase